MNLPRPKIEDTWVFIIGCGLALISGIFWREITPGIWQFLNYTMEFARWCLEEMDKQDFFIGKVVVYTIVSMGVVWLWGYSAGQKSKGKE